MRRLLVTTALGLLALFALASTALGATPKPTITSVSPKQVPIGGTLILKGKNFASGARHNRVFFSRASDGKAVRVRPKKASKTRMEVVVPKTLSALLTADGAGGKKATRFRLMIFTKVLGPKTRTSRSPLILPAGAIVPGAPGAPGTSTTPPPPPDCDGDGTPDAQDADDDNDGLSDDLENQIHTNVCGKDTDGDGIEDGYEYWSAVDLNGNAVPYAGKRPYPNPLFAGDADSDFDGDGMSNKEEFNAWNLYGGRILPTGPGQTFPYSDGNQTSPAADGPGAMDLDGNGRITDNEKDADGDNLANWIEMAKTVASYPLNSSCLFVESTGPAPAHYGNAFTDCGSGPLPNANTFGNVVTPSTANGTKPPAYLATQLMNYLDPDTDGDGIPDGADDNDFDGLSNREEITAGGDGFYTEPQDPCDPDVNARTCPLHT
ncbi:MAG TPA: IPT/TIG domain-containing protein [Thermoleophilaceae bacterium]|jgi:hypothetical protein|nr:IPT/TIG domain-containing protein [Thermoleophilaceae bacterium]